VPGKTGGRQSLGGAEQDENREEADQRRGDHGDEEKSPAGILQASVSTDFVGILGGHDDPGEKNGGESESIPGDHQPRGEGRVALHGEKTGDGEKAGSDEAVVRIDQGTRRRAFGARHESVYPQSRHLSFREVRLRAMEHGEVVRVT
jgi:hypothetical protein